MSKGAILVLLRKEFLDMQILTQQIALSLEKGFLSILENLQEKAEPLFVKISPTIEFDKQVFYLKEAKETDSQATIVSENHASSPFGLIIHTNAPVQVEEKNLRLAFAKLWEVKKEEPSKTSLWKKWFG